MNPTNNLSDLEINNRKIKWYWDTDILPIDIFFHGGTDEKKEYYETHYSINDKKLCDLEFLKRAEYFYFIFKSLANTYLEIDGKAIDGIPLDKNNPMTEYFRLRSYQLADVKFKQIKVPWLENIMNQIAKHYKVLNWMGSTYNCKETLKEHPNVPEEKTCTIFIKTETIARHYARAVENRHIVLSEILHLLFLYGMKLNLIMYVRNKKEDIGCLLFNNYFPLLLHTLDSEGTSMGVFGQIICSDPDITMYAKKLTDYQILFMILHEMSHIMGSHVAGVDSNRCLMKEILENTNDEFLVKIIEHLDYYKNEHEKLYKELEADINAYTILLKWDKQEREDIFIAISNTFSFNIVAEQLRNRIKGIDNSEKLGHFYVRKTLLNSFQKTYQCNVGKSSFGSFLEDLYENLQRLLIQEMPLEYILSSIRNINKDSDILPENR